MAPSITGLQNIMLIIENVILHVFYDIVVMFDNTRRQKKKQVHNDNTECVDILKAIT